MLSSAHHRAGRFDVQTLPTARGFALETAEGVLWHRLVVEDRRKTPRPGVAHALLRVERV
eukprot:4265602-Prymnesium_polylepis.1